MATTRVNLNREEISYLYSKLMNDNGTIPSILRGKLAEASCRILAKEE